jgi:lon-related putative ATP-dependent protease
MAKKVTGKSTLPKKLRIKTEQLRWVCDPKLIPAKLSSELKPIDGLLGQERALEAVSFGLDIPSAGYNIFVHGDSGSGKHNAIMSFVNQRATEQPRASDWLYVQNFEVEHKPVALRLPAGEGTTFKHTLDEALNSIAEGLPSLLEGDDTKARQKAIEEAFREAQEAGFEKINAVAEKKGLGISQTAQGFSVVPMNEGAPYTPEAFEQLPKKEKEALQKNMQSVQQLLSEFMGEEIPELDKARQDRLKALYDEVTDAMVSHHLLPVMKAFGKDEAIKNHLQALADDLSEHTPLLAQLAAGTLGGESGGPQSQGPEAVKAAMKRYTANLLVSQEKNCEGAPVVYEDWPGVGRMIGRIEHISRMGALETNFNLIKAGALHRANGGYLLLDARRVLAAPDSWETLKRALRTSEIAIDSPYSAHSAQTTVTLEPATIPLDVKVIIVGSRSIYYRLAAMDPDFSELFKVAADFDDRIAREKKNIADFSRLLAGIAANENLKALNRSGMAAVVEHAVRMTDDQERMTLRVGPLADLLREANYVAGKQGHRVIGREDVRTAIEQQINRVDRIRQRYHERIHRESVLIDVNGYKTGQINGLAVMSVGGFRFGKPSRITARTRMGAGRVIDIERGSDLGGSIHSKGILILSSYLSNNYAREVPVTMSASIAFEQSYGGVDGDSASSTELYALLSSLSGVPINQGLSVTGSVNQFGEVQVIGGANEKIEGFFDICSGRPGGLTGEQGVLLPEGNVKNLMLRPDIVAACKAGKFHIYSISHIDEGIEILTGRTAGKRNAKTGLYPEDSINRLVEDQLITFAEMRRDFGRGKRSDADSSKAETDKPDATDPGVAEVKGKTTPVKKAKTKRAAKKKKSSRKKPGKLT